MVKKDLRNRGIFVETPKQKCNDLNCPYHGKLSLRGRQFTGIIVSTRMRKTAVIEFDRLHFFKKFERYGKRRTRLKAHNPECINAKEGEIVKAMECRPLSKTKNIVIIGKLGEEKGFKVMMQARQEAKIEKPRKQEDEIKAEGNN